MVNLASKTFSENKNILLSHSKKIKKPCHEQIAHKPKYSTNYSDIDYNANPAQENPQKSFIQIALNEVNGAQSYQLESYQPFYNLIFCPDLVKEMFSTKNQMTTKEMRQKMINLKTPMSDSCFNKNLEKMKALSSNHDLLIQNYLKDKYTNSNNPRPEVLKEYYKYIKAKLMLSQNFNKNNNKFPPPEEENEAMLNERLMKNMIKNASLTNKSTIPWHGHIDHPHHHEKSQYKLNCLESIFHTPVFTNNSTIDDEERLEKENRNEKNIPENISCGYNNDIDEEKEKVYKEIFGNSFNSNSDEESSVKFNSMAKNDCVSWINEDDFLDNEKLYNIL